MRVLLCLDLPEDVSHLSALRHAARAALASCRVPASDAADIETILGELASNAAIHAQAGADFRVEIAATPEVAVVTVADQGVGFSREAVAPPGTARANAGEPLERIGGWGLPMVETLADEFEVAQNQPQGTRVRAVKRLGA